LKKNIEPIKANPWSEFTKVEKIGEGSTANVFKVANSSGQVFALKEIKVNSQMMMVFEEYNKTVLCENENVIKSFALYLFNSQYSILLEYMEMTLFNLIDTWERDDENIMAYILKQILKGLEFIHNGYSIHRDLKADNILINHLGEVKISDFGLCAQLFRDKDQRETFAGSPLWTAPEILKAQKYTSKCDIWSVGMICFELISGVPAYSDCKNMIELSLRIDKEPEPRIPETWSKSFQEFVSFCLKYEPNDRLSASELLNTKFMKRVNEVSAKDRLASLVQRKLE
jgi:serine/threonine protein kinase